MPNVTIVSHNAAWFLGYPQPTEQPDGYDAGILGALARLYKSYTPDVLCVQEVHTPEVCLALGQAVNMVGVHTPGAERPQYGGAIYGRMPLTVDDSRHLDRKPLRFWQKASLAAGEETLTVCNLHLVSDKFLGDHDVTVRAEDIDGMLGNGVRPDVIAGDFNEPPSGPSGERLAASGYIDVGALAANPPASTGVDKERSDLIWVAPAWATRVAALDYVPYPALMNGDDAYLSDHHVLVLRLAW